MSLPPDYSNEINSLNREIIKQQPSDILQFCADHFLRRLASQRAEFLLAQRHSFSKDSPASSNFPGNIPFGALSSSSKPGMRNIQEEEEENDTIGSPTAPTSQSYNMNSASGGASARAEQSSGGMFGKFFGGFGTTTDPSTFAGSSDMDMSGLPGSYNLNRRTSVSAESLNPNADSENWTPPNHPKSSEQKERLKAAVSGNFLFSHLDDDQSAQVLAALQEKPIPAKGIKVISQGDVGDYFYVVEKGSFDIYVNPSGHLESGPDGMGKKVSSIGSGGSFGELALMYNAPRAATVVSTKPSTLWALDRVTFRRILMDSAFQRRRMYESFLEEVPLLSTLTPYERSKIADALDTKKFPAGTTIISEGDPGDAFYFLESGEAEVFIRGEAEPVHRYKKGDYFGELALLNDKPRAASVVSTTEVKVAMLGKDGFQRLLGPVEGIMRRRDPSKAAGAAEEVDPLAAN